MQHTPYQLTRYSHGAGCGCKISPAILSEILNHSQLDTANVDTALLVGNADRDDAAVYDLGDGSAVISTTDFFMPIVDDPVDFGRIAAVNALSDVYAMGGNPLVAIAILGWPVNELPAEAAGLVLRGAQLACSDAGIPLAGGHSIDSPEPIFGLAVTGRVRLEHLKRNGGARAGDVLYLTKPLGVGILTTAQKKGQLDPAHFDQARDTMIRLNRLGAVLGKEGYVHAMTDVTGFGLAGHLVELCHASGICARVHFDTLPVIAPAALMDYHQQGCVPGGTQRNFASYGHHLVVDEGYQRDLVCDPQTSGGLLIAVDPESTAAFEALCRTVGETPARIGLAEPCDGDKILVCVD
ncbi:MAG: selenide, water dikinase SelD [Saprospiraceae bacterium]|nr:selenide, water dikinase SelD [Saprospiraceae bacterium]